MPRTLVARDRPRRYAAGPHRSLATILAANGWHARRSTDGRRGRARLVSEGATTQKRRTWRKNQRAIRRLRQRSGHDVAARYGGGHMSAAAKRKPKRITLTIDVSEHFVKMLQATCQIGRLVGKDQKDQMTALSVLGVVVLGEARGAFPEQVHAMTPIEWRGHIKPANERG